MIVNVEKIWEFNKRDVIVKFEELKSLDLVVIYIIQKRNTDFFSIHEKFITHLKTAIYTLKTKQNAKVHSERRIKSRFELKYAERLNSHFIMPELLRVNQPEKTGIFNYHI